MTKLHKSAGWRWDRKNLRDKLRTKAAKEEPKPKRCTCGPHMACADRCDRENYPGAA